VRCEEIGSVCVANKRLEVLVLCLQVLANIEELSTLVLPEVTLHVFALESAHLDSQPFEPVVGLQLHLSLPEQAAFQVMDFLLALLANSVEGASFACSIHSTELLDLPVP